MLSKAMDSPTSYALYEPKPIFNAVWFSSSIIGSCKMGLGCLFDFHFIVSKLRLIAEQSVVAAWCCFMLIATCRACKHVAEFCQLTALSLMAAATRAALVEVVEPQPRSCVCCAIPRVPNFFASAANEDSVLNPLIFDNFICCTGAEFLLAKEGRGPACIEACFAAMPNEKSFGTMIIAYGMCDALCAAVNSLGGNDPGMFEAFRKVQQMLALAADVADPSRQFELHLFRKDSLPSDVPLGNRRNLVDESFCKSPIAVGDPLVLGSCLFTQDEKSNLLSRSASKDATYSTAQASHTFDGTLGTSQESFAPPVPPEGTYQEMLSRLVKSVSSDLAHQLCLDHLIFASPKLDHDHLGKESTLSGQTQGRNGDANASPWKQARPSKLLVATYNGNAWTTLRRFLRSTKASVVMGQEHKLTAGSLLEARLWAKNNGWQAFFAEGALSDKEGKSAGVFVCVKAHLQAWVPEQCKCEFWKHRGMGIVVSAGGLGPVLFCSCYFHTNTFAKTKAIPANLRMLAGLATFSKQIGLPVCVGADWNMVPEVVANTGLLKCLGWHIKRVASVVGSCVTNKGVSVSDIDFFVCSDMITDVIEDVYYCKSTPARPHKPVLLQFCCRPKQFKAMVLKEPKRIPVDPPFGPLPPPRCWDDDIADVIAPVTTLEEGPSELAATHYADSLARPEEVSKQIGLALTKWFSLAERDLLFTCGSPAPPANRGETPAVVFVNVINTFKAGGSGISLLSSALRWVNLRFRDLSVAVQEWCSERQYPRCVTTRRRVRELLDLTLRRGRVKSPFRRFRMFDSCSVWHPKLKSVCLQIHNLYVLSGFRRPDSSVCKAIQARCDLYAGEALVLALDSEKEEASADSAGWKAWTESASQASAAAAHKFS